MRHYEDETDRGGERSKTRSPGAFVPSWRAALLIPWLALAPCTALSPTAWALPASADTPETHWQRAEELYETHHLAPDRFARALEEYEKELALRPDDYELLWEISKRYQIYGQTLSPEQSKEKVRAWRRGVELGRRAVKVRPEGKEGHFYLMANLGAIAQLKGTLTSLVKFRKIKKEMDRTLEIDPDWPPALLARAQFLMEMPGLFGGDRREALRLCRRAIELDPGHLPAYVTLARLLADQGRYDEAAAALDKVLSCKEPRQYANYLKVDRPRAEAVLREIREKTCGPR